MTAVLQELLELLDIEKIEENLFRGQCQDLGFHSVFGGQVIGQALVAAAKTVENRKAHSMHAYFLVPGDTTLPIIYDVDRIRDGKSFTTRRVVAIQKGRPIFNMSISFQIAEEGFEHQIDMPKVTPPEELQPDLERVREVAHLIPERYRAKWTCDRPIEFRSVDPNNLTKPEKRKPVKHVWMRTNGKMPSCSQVHQCVLAYASDFGLLGTSLLPHGLNFYQPTLQVASLDHAMWFHHDFRMDDWVLYTTDSPSASHARGHNRGMFFTKDGKLIGSVCQEGLIRPRPAKNT